MVEFDNRPYIVCGNHVQLLYDYRLPKNKGLPLILEFPYVVHEFFNDWIINKTELEKFHIIHNGGKYTLYKGIVKLSKHGCGRRGLMRVEAVTSIESYTLGIR